MSRQRLRPGMIEATTQPCPHCHGTGLIRSDDNLALSILRQIEEEGVRRRSREVLVRCPVGIANFLVNQKREHVAQIEARYGLSVRVEGDTMLVSPDFSLEKFKTAMRSVPEVAAPVVSVDSSVMDEADAATEAAPDEEVETPAEDSTEESPKPKKRRRRRRRRSKSKSEGTETQAGETEDAAADPGADSSAELSETTGPGDAADPEAEVTATPDEPESAVPEDSRPKPKRTRKPRKSAKTSDDGDAAASGQAAETAAAADEGAQDPAPKPRSRRKKKAPKPQQPRRKSLPR